MAWLLRCGLLISFLFFSACFLPSTDSKRHVVTSVLRMSYLATFERELLHLARKHSAVLPRRFLHFVSSVEAEYEAHQVTGSDYANVPIYQYRLIRRFTFDWQFWRRYVKEHADDKAAAIAKFLTSYQELSLQHGKIDQFPDIDLSIAAYSLSYIQLFYGDYARLLPNAVSADYPTLTEFEMLEIAVLTYSNIIQEADDIDGEEDEEDEGFEEENQIIAQHWLKLFVDRFATAMPYASITRILDYFLKHLDRYGRPDLSNVQDLFPQQKGLEALMIVRSLLEKNPKHVAAFRDSLAKDPQVQICQHVDDRRNGSFHCFHFRSPLTPYAPFQFEIFSLQPYVAVVHNFIPKQMARRMIDACTESGSYVTGVLSPNGTSHEDLAVRLSEATYLHPLAPASMWLDRRVEEATLLLPNSGASGEPDGEPAQVLNYGVGGFYRAHHDFLERKSRKGTDSLVSYWGDRLASVLIYLSDVSSGGHTAFPKLGVSVVPRAGRALVWFNLDPWDGSQLDLSLHAACPVNVGSKWAVNKWIRNHKKTGHSRPIII